MLHQQTKTHLPFEDNHHLIVEYPDYFFPVQNKKVKVKDLGQKFAAINSFFYEYLKKYHIPCAYVKSNKNNSLLYLNVQQLPFSVKILNAADKRTAKIFSINEGTKLELPVFEYHYGDSKDSIVSESHLISFEICTNEELKLINRICSKLNAVMNAFFERRGETVSEVTCSFGKCENKIYLVDDFSPLSLKVFTNGKSNNLANPYSLKTSSEMRKYTDFLYNITNS
jgi:phosphoribosylaminoimidazole-succinocarboxamide synthase